MITASTFQRCMDIMKQWWLCSLQVSGQHALTDASDRASALCRMEIQTRGWLHAHVMIWTKPPAIEDAYKTVE